jgi:magnesium chelatase accessory protein
MMAAWDLSRGSDKLQQLNCPVRILVGDNDGTVPPLQARQAMGLLSDAKLDIRSGYGHLVHEETPQQTVKFCLKNLQAN